MKKSIKKQLNTSDIEALNHDQLENVAGGYLWGDYFPHGILDPDRWNPWGGGFPGGVIPGFDPSRGIPVPFG